mmetsp:Transcript_15021/g.24538  ORF Transcript_15021/g.24538 Transcript_15021/m.24538 type:complete len:81 (-) Transcript_15021:29-271(-)
MPIKRALRRPVTWPSDSVACSVEPFSRALLERCSPTFCWIWLAISSANFLPRLPNILVDRDSINYDINYTLQTTLSRGGV